MGAFFAGWDGFLFSEPPFFSKGWGRLRRLEWKNGVIKGRMGLVEGEGFGRVISIPFSLFFSLCNYDLEKNSSPIHHLTFHMDEIFFKYTK